MTTNGDAQEEDNFQNAFQYACISSNKAMTKEITDRVEASITDPILRHPGGVWMKKKDEWHLQNW